MFGYVTANVQELTGEQRSRYGAVYCGICRGIRAQSGQVARLMLRYDMAFLALLLMSLYEPREHSGRGRCLTHPLRPRDWTDCEIIRYCAAMNVALGYYQCADDFRDDGRAGAKWMADRLEPCCQDIARQYPRQWEAMGRCIRELSRLEQENCPNPDRVAACFGELMGELLVLREDHWAPTLRQLGGHLGRFIYLMDAAADYREDLRRGRYNPYIAMGQGEDRARWEEYLVNIMGRCADCYERLPLVQDKQLLDNILYSGVWVNYRRKGKGDKSDD